MATRYSSALQNMEGSPFPVLCSAGAEGRAEKVSALLERAHRYLRGVLGFDPVLRLLVLSPDDWAEHAAFPLYGMPHYTERDTIIVSAGPADFWQGVVRMLDGVLTQDQRAEVETVYGMADGKPDMSAYADLIAVHELGHLFHEQVPFAFPRLWLMELFANLCVHAYLAEKEPERVPLWTVLPERMMSLPANRVRHRSWKTSSGCTSAWVPRTTSGTSSGWPLAPAKSTTPREPAHCGGCTGRSKRTRTN